ncbi:Rib/alpha-like domain-containing protein [Aliicoccus persicus]|uniref:Signal peptide-containing protein, YSIRK family n=1 Tax=Aliicoccus persicus TaxID=930138 RepID=A0A662Z7F9_9STAP|nr:Rib/alpha-like domain-containing protein [Aliicoccus persicus]SEW06773.1 signal peptide-containing protein, YSIRK family [Aliicoccus persicus]
MNNKKQKFSIRKFNVGVGSVLIGSLVTIGVTQNVLSEEVVDETLEGQLEDIHIESDEEIVSEEIVEEQVEDISEEIEVESSEEVEEAGVPEVEETVVEEVEVQQEVEQQQEDVPDAEQYEPNVSHVYKMFRSATTEEDIVNAVSIPDYEGTYTIESTSSLPGAMINREHAVEALVTFEDGSMKNIVVPVTVLGMGPSTQIVENPTVDVLNHGDELPNPEDYIVNMDEIRAFYAQYDMEVTAVWGQAYHSEEEKIDKYFSEDTKFTLIRILVDGERLTLKTFQIDVQEVEVPDAEQYEVEIDHVYKMFRSATTEEDIVNAVSIPDYEGTYTVESTSSLPGAMINREHKVEALVTFEDGSTKEIIVPVTVLDMGPRTQIVENPTAEALNYGDELPNPEDYIVNMDDIRAFYAQYDMEVTAEWGQAYHSEEDIIDKYFSEDTKFTLIRILVDGERLTLNTFHIDVQPEEVPDAEQYEVEIDHVYKMFRSATTEEDIVNAVSIPDYEGTYTIESTSSLPGAMINREHAVEALVTFEDGSTKNIVVPVTVLGMGPRTQIVENPTAEVLNYGDELPNPEDYIVNMDDIRAFYAQYDMEVTAEWGQAYHSEEDIIDKYFSEDTKFTLIRILVDGERLTLNTFQIDVQPDEDDAEVYEVEVDHIYKGFKSPKSPAVTEEDIVKAVTIPNYDGDYTVEITSSLDRIRTPQNYEVEAVVRFEDGSTQNITVPVSVLPPGQAKKFFNGK